MDVSIFAFIWTIFNIQFPPLYIFYQTSLYSLRVNIFISYFYLYYNADITLSFFVTILLFLSDYFILNFNVFFVKAIHYLR